MIVARPLEQYSVRHAGIFIGVQVLLYLAVGFVFSYSESASNYALITTITFGFYLARLLRLNAPAVLIIFLTLTILVFLANLFRPARYFRCR